MDNNPNILISLLESMDFWKWMVLGVALLVLELLTGTLFILWPAIAAIMVAFVVALLPLGWEMQLVLFAILSTIGLIWGEKYLRPKLTRKDGAKDLNDRAGSMIGQHVTALTDFKTGRGRVKIDDTEWAAKLSSADINPKKGDELKIIAVSGASVTVETV